MPSKKQNREYLRDVVLPHLRETWERQEIRMLKTLGTTYTDVGGLVDEIKGECEPIEWPANRPALLDFSVYDMVYSKNCNIIDDQYNCGRTGCFAGWYVMMSEQARRFQPWDPQWLAIKGFSTVDLARHFNISIQESADLFSSMGEGIEKEGLEEVHGYDGEDYGDGYQSIEEIATGELTQGEVLEMRADYLDEVMA